MSPAAKKGIFGTIAAIVAIAVSAIGFVSAAAVTKARTDDNTRATADLVAQMQHLREVQADAALDREKLRAHVDVELQQLHDQMQTVTVTLNRIDQNVQNLSPSK